MREVYAVERIGVKFDVVGDGWDRWRTDDMKRRRGANALC